MQNSGLSLLLLASYMAFGHNAPTSRAPGQDYGISDMARCLVELHRSEQLPPILKRPGYSKTVPSLMGKLHGRIGIFVIDPGSLKTYFAERGAPGEGGIWRQWLSIGGMPPLLASIDMGDTPSAQFSALPAPEAAHIVKPLHIASNSSTAIGEIERLFTTDYLNRLERTARAESLAIEVKRTLSTLKQFDQKAVPLNETLADLRESVWHLNYYSRLPPMERLEACVELLKDATDKARGQTYLAQIRALNSDIRKASGLMHRIGRLTGALEF